MDNFSGVLADHMDAEQSFVSAGEQHFQEPDIITDNFAASAVVVPGASDDEIDAFLGQCLL